MFLLKYRQHIYAKRTAPKDCPLCPESCDSSSLITDRWPLIH